MLHPVFDPGMALALARGAAAASVWNALRHVVEWLEQPGVRDLPAHEAAGLLRDVIRREVGE
jgi:hypothetical protein